MIKLSGIFILGFVLYGVSGCVTVPAGQDQPSLHSQFSKSERLRTAQGTVIVSSTPVHSNSIEIVIKNLVRPQRLDPRARNYVVWEVFNGGGAKPQSVGALSLDKDMTGHLQTATPFRNFDLFITVEPGVAQASPTGEKLFWVSVNRE